MNDPSQLDFLRIFLEKTPELLLAGRDPELIRDTDRLEALLVENWGPEYGANFRRRISTPHGLRSFQNLARQAGQGLQDA